MNLTESDKQRFWSKVVRADGDGCWLWIGTIDGANPPLGRFAVRGKNQSARRVAYAICYGSLSDRHLVLTKCGQALCMRPDHLYVGTHYDRPHAVEPPLDRFLRAVEKSAECWEWIGCRSEFGYGLFELDGKAERAHRFSYAHFVGPIPPGQCVLHRCDNPGCVNPAHLFLGTRSANAHDKVAKDRQARGVQYHHAVLNPELVRKIRKMRHMGAREIGSILGVNRGTVGNVLRGKAWKHVKGDA